MRICLVSSYGLGQVSGITSFVMDLGEELSRRGHSVAVLGTSPLPSAWPPSVEYWDIQTRAPLGDVRLAIRTAQVLWRNRREWDVVHSQQGHVQTVVAVLIARFRRRRGIVTFHMLPPPSRGMRGVWERLWTGLSLAVSTDCVFVSRHTRESFHHWGTVIPNGIDVARIERTLGDREQVRQELGLDGFVVGFAGRKTENKGFFDFLSAMREVRDSGENVRALVTGEEPVESRGAAESRTQELGLAPYISDLGSRDDHLRFLSAMDAFALPSYREGMPLAILEAMAAGLPIVATRVGGIPEVLRDNEEGFMIEPGDKSALADRIRLLARDLALRGAIARRSKARASEFTLDRMTASYEEVYRGS